MLMIIAIVALLAGIALPTILSVREQISVQATQATLNNLEAGCKLYRDDWGVYPPDDPGEMEAWGIPSGWDGSQILPQCLLGWFGDSGDDGDPDPDEQDDGVTGYGFRMQANKRKAGPYVDPDKIPIERKGDAVVFVDDFEKEIHYARFDDNFEGSRTAEELDYFQDNDDEYFRRDFFLWSYGPDTKKTAFKDDTLTDDITNFLPE
jgi:type II secretory pathway pseudopilin PulG